MKQFIQLIFLLAFSALQAQNDSVTFKVDLNDYTGSFTTVNVNGTFNGWCGGCNAMTDADGDGVWEALLPLTAGSIEYKFTLDGWTNQESFAGGEPCTVTNGGFTNRSLVFTSDTVLPVVCYNSCSVCTGVVLSQVDLPISWDDATVSYNRTSFGGMIDSLKADPTDPTNMVVKLDKGLGTQVWAGTTLSSGGLATALPFTMGGANTISLWFWSADAGVPVLLKVEDKTNGGIFVETFDTTTLAGGWEVLVFDFNNTVAGAPSINLANTYDMFSIFPNFGTDGNTAGAKSYYVDDVVWGSIVTGMSGIYTINPSAAASATNYTSFSSAAADLVSLGVVGACTFNVSPGSYTDTVYLPTIMGTSMTNTITFNGGDSATTSLAWDATSGQRATILMDGADWVSFQNLTISHSATTDAWGIRLTNDNDNFSVNACRFEMAVSASTSSDVTGIGGVGSPTSSFTETEAGDDISISNSAFIDGQYGVHFESLNFADTNLTVSGCDFVGNYYRYFMSDNTYGTTLNNNTASGMAYATGYGFAIYDVVELNMSGNNVVAPYYATYIADLNFDGAPSAVGTIANNFFISSGASGQEGFYCDDCEQTNFYYNSFSTNSSSTSAYGAYFNDLKVVDIRNNVFYGTSAYALWLSDNSTVGTTSSDAITLDYNAYHTVNGANLGYDGGIQADLAAWQAARAGNNTNSVSGDPIFINPAADLHVAGVLLNNIGTPIASITNDVDGDMRSATAPDLGADEYMPATCLPVSALASSMQYADSAMVNWLDGNASGTTYTVEYGVAGFTLGTGAMVAAHPDTFLLISGLTANTAYEFYVTADCGADGSSSAAGPGSFRTTLAAPRAIVCAAGLYGSLLTEDFDNSTTFTGGIGAGNGSWLYDNNTTGSASTGPSGPHSGSHYIFFETSTGGPASNAMVSPAVDLSAGAQNAELTFWLHAYGASIGVLDVGVSTSATGPFTSVFTYGPGQLQSDELDPWQQVGVDLDAYLGQTVYIQFNYTRGSTFTGDIGIDLVEVKSCLSCLVPSNLVASNIADVSADITWTSGASNLGSTLEYGLAGFTPGTGTLITSNTGAVSLINLMPSTDYDVYVTDSCGLGDISGALGPVTFKTLCPGVFAAPYSTNFENITLGGILAWENCWYTYSTTNPRWESENSSGTNENSTATGPFYDNTTASAAGGNYMYLETSGGALGDTNGLHSPNIDISTLTSPEVVFFYHMYGAAMGNLYLYAEDTAGTRVALDSILGQQQTAGGDAWLERRVDLSGLTGSIYKFIFIGARGTSFTSDMSVDDFSVGEAPSCFASSALMAVSSTNTSATVTWTAGTGTSWNVEYGPAGFTPGTGTLINSTNDTLTIGGLMASSTYDFYVTDSCNGGFFSTATGPGSFTTSACAASDQCAFTFDLYDTFGDGWNAGTITVWQNGVAVATLGSTFSTGVSSLGATVNLCNNIPTVVTLSAAGGFPNEMGLVVVNPNGDTAGVHTAIGGLATGDTLLSFNADCNSCAAVIAPFFESFELNSPTIACWNNVFVADSLPWSIGSGSTGGSITAAYAGNTNAVFVSQNGGPDTTWLLSPVIDMSALVSPQLSFWYAQEVWFGDQNVTNVYYRTSDTSPWVLIFGDASSKSAWTQATVTLPNGSSTYQLAFEGVNNWGHAQVIDSLSITDANLVCTSPDSVAANNVTATTADISWLSGANSSSSWIEYGLIGFTPGTGSIVNPATSLSTLTNLMSGATYEACVYDICSTLGDTSSASCVTFTTLCPAVVVAPYSTGFEGISLGNLSTYENCWSTNVGGNPRWESEDAPGFNENSGGTGPLLDNTLGVPGGTYMFLETSSPSSLGDTNVLYSPVVDFSGLTNPQISFWYHMHGATMGNLRIWAENTSGVRFILDSIIGQQQLAQADPWLQLQIPVSSLAAGNYRFLFEGVGGTSFNSDMSIDDFAVEEAPSCFPSSMLSAISSTNNAATITWMAGTGTSWDVEYGIAGFTPGTGIMFNATNDTVTVSGLLASTAYDFYVTDSCGAGGLATTAGPGSFTTAACPASDQCLYTVDLYDTFGDGWNGGTITFSQNGVAVATFGSAFATGTSSLGATVALCDNLPTTVTLSAAGGFPNEMGFVVVNPNGDTAGVHIAVAGLVGGDTLLSYTTNCSACPAVVAPYFESFEVNSPTIACWTNVFIADSALWSIGTGSTGGVITAAYAGNTNAVFVSQNGGPDTTWLVSPVIDMSALVSPQLSFWYAQEEWFGDQNVTNVYYRTSDTSPWTFLFGDASNVTTWTQAIMSLPNPTATYQIAIEGVNNWGHAQVIDSLSITDVALTCSLPDSVAASNITTTTADISWISGANASTSWIEYGLLGFTPGTGSIVNPATSATTLTNLMSGTLYEACVYDICSTLGDTSMAACVVFNTLCAPVTVYPYVENFDNGIFPPCYSETTTSGGGTGPYTWRVDAGGTPSGSTGPAVDHTTGSAAGFYMYVEASAPAAQGDSAFLMLEQFDMTSLTNPEIVYYAHMYGADIVNLALQVYDTTTMTWSTINNIVGQQQTGNGDAWLEARINLSAYTANNALTMRFLSVRGASFNGDAAVDDITIRETPPCIDAANFAVVTASTNSVTLSWDSDTNIVASTIQYGPVGFTLGSGTNFVTTAGGTIVTGLAGTTCYDFYVMDSCSAGTNWVGPVTACTIASCSVTSTPSSTTNDTTDCDGGSVTLSAVSSTSNNLVWLTNGIARETGSSYFTDSVGFTTAFDVSEYVTTSPSLHIGPLSNIATAGYGNFSNGQYINVVDTVHIDSMVVNHLNDVIGQVLIWDASITNVLQLGDTFSTPTGITGDMQVPVNMVLTPGVYFMNVNFIAGGGQLFRATGGAAYPYDLAGLMSIDSTNFGDQSRIYYTFDMTVSKACIGPSAQAFAVVPGANAGISDTNLVCSTDVAADLASFLGVHDNGGVWTDVNATGALTDSILDATQLTAGNIYEFQYILAGVNGCLGDTAFVFVDIEAAPFAGADTSLAVCLGGGITILRNFITGNPFGGRWVDLDGSGGLNVNSGVFNSNNANLGTFNILYILSGTVCAEDTAVITLTVDSTAFAGAAVSDSVCDDEAMVDLNTFLDPSATAGGMWMDLSATGALTGNMFDASAVTNSASYNFQYMINSACGDDSVTVTLFVEDCDVSVRELSTGFINIYPNPTSGLIKIDDNNVAGKITVEVYAGNGQLMINKVYAENEEIRVDISEFATGIYTVKVNSKKGLDVKRIMKN